MGEAKPTHSPRERYVGIGSEGFVVFHPQLSAKCRCQARRRIEEGRGRARGVLSICALICSCEVVYQFGPLNVVFALLAYVAQQKITVLTTWRFLIGACCVVRDFNPERAFDTIVPLAR